MKTVKKTPSQSSPGSAAQINGEVRKLKEKIASLEHEGLPHGEDYYSKCYAAYQDEIEAAARDRFYDERQLNATISSLQGSTMCIQLGKKGRCQWTDDGKCSSCNRSEVGFNSSYTLHAWRNEEDKIWQQEKDRFKHATEHETAVITENLLKEKQQWEEERSTTRAEHAAAIQQLQADRDAFEKEKQEWEEKRNRQVSQWEQYTAASVLGLQNDRTQLKHEQAQWEIQQNNQLKIIQQARDELDTERTKFLEERLQSDFDLRGKQAEADKYRNEQVSLRMRDDILRHQWREEVAEFEAFKQQQYNKELEWSQECARLIRKERQMMVDQRREEEELMEAHKKMWCAVKERELRKDFELEKQRWWKFRDEKMQELGEWKEEAEEEMMRTMKEFTDAKDKWMQLHGITEPEMKKELAAQTGKET
eukprot:TRINITY_DN48628_c0_g1_i1.p1 TRINITY_DN48628_c0_g1~~TRINITY_DN48628_c0_g1_i1.p1  ORF type:complete len:421 (-),score=81.74 TRINITY_DN48628_c0_g1_i1:1100-2362(-)